MKTKPVRQAIVVILATLAISTAWGTSEARVARQAVPNVFLSLVEGSSADIQSASSIESEPLYGHLGFRSLPAKPPGASSQVVVEELVMDVPAEVPLGLVHIELVRPANLSGQKDGSTSGQMRLDVSLPLYGANFIAVGEGSLRGSPWPDNRIFELNFNLRTDDQLLEPSYAIHLSAQLAQDTVEKTKIIELIADLDDDDVSKREAATVELIEIGRPALEFVRKALPKSDEQKQRLLLIIKRIEQVTSRLEQIGSLVGVFNFTFDLTPNVDDVCDVHFIVGKPDQSAIDHSNSTITLSPFLKPFPKGWTGSYNGTKGEYQFNCRDPLRREIEPLTRGSTYRITIRTESMAPRTPGMMGWYWTDESGEKFGEAGETQGPVFLK